MGQENIKHYYCMNNCQNAQIFNGYFDIWCVLKANQEHL